MAGLASVRVCSPWLVASLSLAFAACSGTSARQDEDGRAASGAAGAHQGAASGGSAITTGGSSAVSDAPDSAICTPATVDEMCVVGRPLQDGYSLDEGMPLELAFRPFGCFSSSCTEVVRGSCDVLSNGNEFLVSTGAICLAGDGCMGSCSDSLLLQCSSENALAAGTYTVVYLEDPRLSLTFTVPSVFSRSLCVNPPPD